MSVIDNSPLTEFLDALKVLATHLWPSGGFDYDVREIAGNIESEFERNRNEVYENARPNIDSSEAMTGEFARVFADLMERMIGAKSDSLGVQLATLLSEPYRDPILRFVAYWDDDVWAMSVTNTNSKRPRLLNMTFQFD